jgi:alkanesulfonate monooxygenase SsuD/methylene tetrahydromethanopterin reductase-like flavin-dependent oxidoreductase (luciferase family)
VETGFSLDPRLQLDPDDELRLVKRGAELGYRSAWTPATDDHEAFDRCLRWYQASGLPVGIAVVPASGRPAFWYAAHALRVHQATGGNFIFGVGSGRLEHAAEGMREYLRKLREPLADGPPIYLAALGPLLLRLAGEMADGVSLNWCSRDMVAWSREVVAEAAADSGRPLPVVAMYIRTCLDRDAEAARSALAQAALTYALGAPAYQRHFERMGFPPEELLLVQRSEAEPTPEFLAAVGAAGAPGEVRAQFERIAGGGLDVAIVRVLTARPGDPAAVELALEECAPKP